MLTPKITNKGFSLVELIAVLVIVGVISGIVSTRLIPNKTFELQTNRDNLLTALLHAQQRAMNRTASIQLTTNGSSIDIRQDDDDNGVFASSESIRIGGISYPVNLNGNSTISSHTLNYNRFGETSENSIRISSGSKFIDITVAESGFAY